MKLFDGAATLEIISHLERIIIHAGGTAGDGLITYDGDNVTVIDACIVLVDRFGYAVDERDEL